MRQFILILAVMLAFAASTPASAYTFESIQHGVEIYNAGVANAPEVVKTLLGDERIQVEISRGNETPLMAGLETKNALIVNAIEGEIEDPTIVVEASEEAVKRVYQADDPVTAFEEAQKEGEISVRGTTFTSKLKVSAALASTPGLRVFAGLIGK